jgi:hypothetical protein
MDQPQPPKEKDETPHYQSVNDVVQVALERMRQERANQATEPDNPPTRP